MKKTVILVMLAALLMGGCSGMSYTEQRTLSGGAIGAAGGALIGGPRGAPALGAAIGAGAGLAGRLSLRSIREVSGPTVAAITKRV